MNYRCMQTGDYEAVMTLWRSCEGLLLRDADSKPRIESYLERNPGLSFVAHAGDAIVGSIMAGHDGKRGYVQHLAVDPGARGQGIASRLLELCLDALKLQGIVLTMVDRRNNLSQMVEADVREHLGDKVYKTTVPRNVRVSEAQSYEQAAIKEHMEKAFADRLAEQETCPVTGRPMAEVLAEQEAANA